MAVDKAALQQLIDEIPFSNAADKAYLLDALGKDESAATQFMGQRLRHSDYTKKTTELSQKEQTLAQKANESVRSYAQQLADAQANMKKIMDDLQNERISRTKAETLLQKTKSVYNLTDEDIPQLGTSDQPKPGAEGLLSMDQVKALIAENNKHVMEQLQPINSFPRIPVILNEIQERHKELLGRRLTIDETNELMTIAGSERGRGLEQEWREKYGINAIEKTKEREAWDKENRTKWEDEQRAAASEAALRGVTRSADGKFQSHSPVMGRKYNEHVDSTPPAQNQNSGQQPMPRVQEPTGPKLSGAERAAAKYIERREQGIPLGQEAPPSGAGR